MKGYICINIAFVAVAVAAGYCGSKLQWSMVKTLLLSILGMGIMLLLFALLFLLALR